MKDFFRKVSPTGAVRDFWGIWRSDQPHRWRFALMAGAVTTGIFVIMFNQEQSALPPPPELVYFPSLLPNRTDEQIRRENLEAAKQAKLARAREAEVEARKRQIYKTMGDVVGMDSEQYIKQGEAERAEQKARDDARNAEVLRKHLAR